MALGTTERGQAEHHQAALELAQIDAPHHQIMREIERARREGGTVDPLAPGAIKRSSARRHFAAKGRDVIEERFRRSGHCFAHRRRPPFPAIRLQKNIGSQSARTIRAWAQPGKAYN